jgi:hypothetical protein
MGVGVGGELGGDSDGGRAGRLGVGESGRGWRPAGLLRGWRSQHTGEEQQRRWKEEEVATCSERTWVGNWAVNSRRGYGRRRNSRRRSRGGERAEAEGEELLTSGSYMSARVFTRGDVGYQDRPIWI